MTSVISLGELRAYSKARALEFNRKASVVAEAPDAPWLGLKGEAKVRDCLRCDRTFISKHFGERICGRCHFNYAEEYEGHVIEITTYAHSLRKPMAE